MLVHADTLPACMWWTVYDHKIGAVLTDVKWADDEMNQLGRLNSNMLGGMYVEQRKRVIIMPFARWIAVDLPEDMEPASLLLSDMVEALRKELTNCRCAPVGGWE